MENGSRSDPDAAPPPRRRTYVVDRVEGDRVILVGEPAAAPAVDAGAEDEPEIVEVEVASFATRPREGAVYRVPTDARGRPEWREAMEDEAEEHRRRLRARERLRRLAADDPGGDLTL